MWMFEVELSNGTRLHAYKHADTRRYVHLDHAGAAFVFEPPDRYRQHSGPIPGPKRGDYKNTAQFGKVERDFWGEEDFRRRYGANGRGANAFGKCGSGAG